MRSFEGHAPCAQRLLARPDLVLRPEVPTRALPQLLDCCALVSAAVLVCVASGCGSDGVRVSDAAASSDGGAVVDASAAPAADAGSTPDGGEEAPLRFCHVGCATVDDCVGLAENPASDADNYSCVAGACYYEGCNDDVECEASEVGPGSVCATVDGLRRCLARCTTASDCGSEEPTGGADNYRCDSGVCIYTGCNDDEECAESFGSSSWVCRAVIPPPGSGPGSLRRSGPVRLLAALRRTARRP